MAALLHRRIVNLLLRYFIASRSAPAPTILYSHHSSAGFKSRRDVPILVEQFMNKELDIDHYITHEFDGVEGTNDAIEALHGGECLRAVVKY